MIMSPLPSEQSNSAAVRVHGLVFGYSDVPILKIDDLSVGRGERVFIHGPSGSGKTTLLGLLSGVLKADRGNVEMLGRNLTSMTAHQRDRFRGDHIGYIFQMFNLIPYLTVSENISLGCELNQARRIRLPLGSLDFSVRSTADALGILNLIDKRVTELSVGQQQRVAVARALLGAPEIIIADEPTSALDFDHREKFLTLLFDESRKAGSTVLFVSHDRQLEPFFDRSVSLPEVNRL